MIDARLLRLGLALGLAMLSMDCGRSERDHNAASPPPLPLQHLFLIMMENQGTDTVIGNLADAPQINKLAQRGAVATRFFGVTHPSMPNYLALISGDFQGIWDDCAAGADLTCTPEEFMPDADDGTIHLLLTPEQIAASSSTKHLFNGRNLVDQLEAKHMTWKGYFQGMPEVGSMVDFAPKDVVDGHEVSRDLYAQRHNPFLYFTSVRNDPGRVRHLVPATQLAKDLEKAETTPQFVWLSPDNCHNMHGVSRDNAVALGMPGCALPDDEPAAAPPAGHAGGQDRDVDRGARLAGRADPGTPQQLAPDVIRLGDAYIGELVAQIMASPAWQERSAIVLVWDEDDFSGYEGCCGSPTAHGQMLGGGRAPLIVLTSHATRPKIVKLPGNHYTLLGTIQHLWGLDCLAHTCDIKNTELLTELFRD